MGRILGRGPIYRGRIYRYAGIESPEAQQPAILGKTGLNGPTPQYSEGYAKVRQTEPLFSARAGQGDRYGHATWYKPSTAS